jgi:hypothetical protein
MSRSGPTAARDPPNRRAGGRDPRASLDRGALGRCILLGLEVLIIADIVRTIIVDTTIASVAALGIIVIIRILLSFSLEVESMAPGRGADPSSLAVATPKRLRTRPRRGAPTQPALTMPLIVK